MRMTCENELLPVTPAGVEVEDEQLLVGGEVAALDVRPEVVQPAEPAALPRPLQPCMMISYLRKDKSMGDRSCMA